MENERTEAQREASRRNGAKSKGPVTVEGKAISSRNSFKHGLDSNHFLLAHESKEAFEAMRATYYEQYQPDNLVEADLLDRYICAMWKAIRFEHIEAGVCAIALADTQKEAATLTGLNQPQRMAVAMIHMMNDKTADKLSTYAQRNERNAARWLKTLETMQKERRAAAQAELGRQERTQREQSAKELARAAVIAAFRKKLGLFQPVEPEV